MRNFLYTGTMLRMNTPTAPTEIMTISAARELLSVLAEASRSEGIEAEIVFCGPHRRPDLTIMPTALFKLVAPILDDLLLQSRISMRITQDDGSRGMSLEEFRLQYGISEEGSAEDEAQYEQDLKLTSRVVLA